MNKLSKAVAALNPALDFRMENDDLATLESLNGEELPSVKDIEAKAKVIEQEEVAKAEAKAVAKAALLERLGITEEEAKLLLA
jgi:hypothetical protein